ncbi:hypothetical protein ACHQM5_004354 [Ranunculus cassubicifolius]
MPERMAPENLLNNIMDTLADNIPKQTSSFFEEQRSNPITEQMNKHFGQEMNRHFGRQKTLHKVLGGGQSADVLLWRNKKISASVLTVATIVWVLFEWLNYHFLSMLFFLLVLGMLAQFLWSNASSLVTRNPSEVPRLRLPEELFVNIGISVGAEVNRFLGFLQDVSTGGNLKQFVMVVVGLWAAAVIGSWCNFLTVIYIGFIAAHTLPVIYEKYDDQIDNFLYTLVDQLQRNYRKIDYSVLSRIPTRRFKSKKSH